MFGLGKKTMFNIIEKEIMWAGKKLTLQTGKIARQATGAVFAKYGETEVLATVVAAKDAKPDQDFFPLTVNYQEKFAASGKIPGSFPRREGRPSTRETLISRLIDRPIRPLFPKTFKNEVQVIATVYNYDKANNPDILAMIASSAAIAISGIPFTAPIGAARVGYIDGKFIINPLRHEIEKSELDLVVAGTDEGVLMVESEANELSEDVMLSAVETGFKSFGPVIKLINEMKKEVGNKEWQTPEVQAEYFDLKEKITNNFAAEIKTAYKIHDKLSRQEELSEIRKKIIESIDENDTALMFIAPSVISDIEAEIMRTAVLNGEKRIDGRKVTEIRPIECEVGILNRNHGSALFTRGETQVLVSATIGVKDDEQLVDDLNGVSSQKFLLHYNFPPFSVGECGKLGTPGRREIGHGQLAWRANHPMLPTEEEFPYTIRVVSDVTESNGSSSMATTCGASLAMMDAGIPVKNPVAGTKNGITALQMDIKITSITFDIMKQALAQAYDGRIHILKKMATAIKSARKELSPYAPTIFEMTINPRKIKDVIGSGGSVIRSICEKSNTKIEILDTGIVKIAGTSQAEIDTAKDLIEKICEEPELGKVYDCEVIKILEFGAIVSFMSGEEGMIHISEFENNKVKEISDLVKVGDKLKAKVVDIYNGKIKLSQKQV